jgi:hypothetical protein
VRGQIVKEADFRGGVDFRGPSRMANSFAYSDEDPGPRKLQYALNVTCDDNGVIRRRAGAVTSTGYNSRIYTSLQYLNGMGIIIAGVSGTGSIIAGFSGGWPSTTMWTITPAGGGSVTSRMKWVEAPTQDGLGPAWGLTVGGATPGLSWDGSLSVAVPWTLANGTSNGTYLTTLPSASYIEHFQGRIFIAGINGDQHALYWSDTGIGGAKPRNWLSTNVVRLEPNSGSAITGMMPAGQNLLVFKYNRIFSIYDTETGFNRTVSNSIGAIPGSIAAGPSGEVYFNSPQVGPCVCDGRSVRRIGDAVRPILPETLGTSALSPAVVFDNHYILGEGALIGTSYYMLDYDITNGSWWLHSIPMAQFSIYQSVGTQQLWGIGSSALGATVAGGAIYHLFRNPFVTDGSVGSGAAIPATNFTSRVDLPWEDYGQPALRKRLRRIRITGKGLFNVSLARDYSGSIIETLATQTGGDSPDPSTTAGVVDLPINGRVSHAFSIRITGDQSVYQYPWQINSVTTAVTMRKD